MYLCMYACMHVCIYACMYMWLAGGIDCRRNSLERKINKYNR